MEFQVKQNIYDDPGFFEGYSEMRRSVGGLEEAGEWPAFREMLPDLAGMRVLDLGCGFGWHCRYAREKLAASVLGIDLSEMMLARAREMTDDLHVEYRRVAIEDAEFSAAGFDVVMSSLAFHYVERLDIVCRKVAECLVHGGSLVFSVEHPIFTSLADQDWCRGSAGELRHWPVDNYQQEGARDTHFIADHVVKYHRTVATYLNTVLEAGFRIARVSEPEPSQEMLAKYPDWKDESRRPMFLIISAVAGR